MPTIELVQTAWFLSYSLAKAFWNESIVEENSYTVKRPKSELARILMGLA